MTAAHASDRWFAFSLLALSFLIYSATRGGQHTYDALMFANAIRSMEFIPSVYRTHNLFYLPTAIGLNHLGDAAGLWDGRAQAFAVGQHWAALWGAVAVWLAYRLIRRALDALAEDAQCLDE